MPGLSCPQVVLQCRDFVPVNKSEPEKSTQRGERERERESERERERERERFRANGEFVVGKG